MIYTKYKIFLLNESITMSNEDIVEIIKSLETEDNKNEKLIKRLVNHTSDKSGKTVLMNIVQSNNEELIDYILKFDININQTLKTGENVLFFCKNVKMFNKFYNLGADVLAKNIHTGTNVLMYLSNKKIFNVELYQKLIDAGVEILPKKDNGYGTYYFESTVIYNSILNKGIVELLIKNGLDLNNDKNTQRNYLDSLLDSIKWDRKKLLTVINIFEYLFKNGLKILDIDLFADRIVNNMYYGGKIDIISDLIIPLKKYFSEDLIILIFKKRIIQHHSNVDNVILAKKLLESDYYPNLYDYLKKHYTESFQKFFGDWAKSTVYEESTKYNL